MGDTSFDNSGRTTTSEMIHDRVVSVLRLENNNVRGEGYHG